MPKHLLLLAASCFTLQAAVISIPQSALLPSAGYYTDSIGGGIGTPLVMTGGGNAANVGFSPNDDGFTGPIDLGFTIHFFGADYTQFWANNNGNISFTGGLAQFTPSGPQGASVPVISPFFGDVDTRGALSGLMSLRNDLPNQIIVTWDQVGYFGAHDDLLNSFQLVLRGPGYAIPAGEGQIGFFWNAMEWETGDASGGSSGFGGVPAAVGFGDGASNGFVLDGSTQDGIAAVVRNRQLWFNLDAAGAPVVVPTTPSTPPTPSSGVPEPSTFVLVGLATGALLFKRRSHLRRNW